MPANPFKPRPPGSLKAAVNEAITAAGGPTHLATLGVGSRSALARLGDPDEPTRQISVRQALLIEAIAGRPIITAFMAAENGCVLLDPSAAEGDGPLAAESAVLAQRVSEFFGELAECLADRFLDPNEAGACVHELDQVLAAAAIMRARLVAVRDSKDGEAA